MTPVRRVSGVGDPVRSAGVADGDVGDDVDVGCARDGCARAIADTTSLTLDGRVDTCATRRRLQHAVLMAAASTTVAAQR